MSSIIPKLNSMVTAEFGQGIVLSLSETGGAEGADVSAPGKIEGVAQELAGVFYGPTLLPPAGNLDFSGAKEIFTQFEQLVSLFHHLAFENNKKGNDSVLAANTAQRSSGAAPATEDENSVDLAVMPSFVLAVAKVPFFLLMESLGVEAGTVVQERANALRVSVKKSVKEILKISGPVVAKKLVVEIASTQGVKDLFGVFFEPMQAAEMSLPPTDEREDENLQSAPMSEQAADSVAAFKDTMVKMNERLHTLYRAQLKAEEAAFRA